MKRVALLANHTTQTLANFDCGGGEDKPCPKAQGEGDSRQSGYGGGNNEAQEDKSGGSGMYETIVKFEPKKAWIGSHESSMRSLLA